MTAESHWTAIIAEGQTTCGAMLAKSLPGAVRLLRADGANLTKELDGAQRAVYLPERGRRGPDARLAGTVASAASLLNAVVLISSAAVYGSRPQHPGHIDEDLPPSQYGRDWYGRTNEVARRWQQLEDSFDQNLQNAVAQLVVLRPAPVLLRGDNTYFSRWLSGFFALTLAGHDPTLQLLSPDDLCTAVQRALNSDRGGVYNVAPAAPIPLRKTLARAGKLRLPVPRFALRAACALLAPLGLSHHPDQLEYIRYAWTVSGAKARRDLGFTPRHSSAQTLAAFAEKREQTQTETYDDFGMDDAYIRAYGRTLFWFLERCYWRIESRGLEHIPRQGRAVLAGVHRGFMPWDAVMILQLVVKYVQRTPRFLIHPTLIRFPFQFNFMSKLGGIIAGRLNADRVLQNDELLGFYPEGIHGAFTPYKNAYGLGKFGRNEFVKTALRNRAPIVPFVTVGSPEIFPIIGRINWRWWKRFTQWPFFPIAPPFPLLPVPLPSKWHTRFLEPLHVERDYPPEAADDKAIVQAIGNQVRDRMQAAVDAMLAQRRSVFFGSIFADSPDSGEPS